MAKVYRPTRVATDDNIIRMNRVGLSLAAIAKLYGCHPTAITLRMQNLGVVPIDARRAFMKDVFYSLEPEIQEWLLDQMNGSFTIMDFIKESIRYIHAVHQGKI